MYPPNRTPLTSCTVFISCRSVIRHLPTQSVLLSISPPSLWTSQSPLSLWMMPSRNWCFWTPETKSGPRRCSCRSRTRRSGCWTVTRRYTSRSCYHIFTHYITVIVIYSQTPFDSLSGKEVFVSDNSLDNMQNKVHVHHIQDINVWLTAAVGLSTLLCCAPAGRAGELPSSHHPPESDSPESDSLPLSAAAGVSG